MADYERTDEVSERTVYRLSSPTNWTEIGKVLAAIRQEFPDCTSDDSVIVEGDGEEIRFVVDQTQWEKVPYRPANGR